MPILGRPPCEGRTAWQPAARARKSLTRGYDFMEVAPLTHCGQGIETPLLEN